MNILFYSFSLIMLFCAAFVVLHRNPVTSAMLLVLVFFFMAGLFVLLEAFFLAVIQVLVYAGAVMVLFLFVMMLLDIGPPKSVRRNIPATMAGITLGLAFLTEFWIILRRSTLPAESPVQIDAGIRSIGRLLFSEYLLAFEIASLLLLVALIGVVLLCRKETR